MRRPSRTSPAATHSEPGGCARTVGPSHRRTRSPCSATTSRASAGPTRASGAGFVSSSGTSPSQRRSVDENLASKLAAEVEGILAWMVEGARRFLAGGFEPPDSVRVSTSGYRDAEDTVAAFFEESGIEFVRHSEAFGLAEVHEIWCRGPRATHVPALGAGDQGHEGSGCDAREVEHSGTLLARRAGPMNCPATPVMGRGGSRLPVVLEFPVPRGVNRNPRPTASYLVFCGQQLREKAI